jgi:hypothetical protein
MLYIYIYIYIYIYTHMEHLFLMFLDHTQRRATVGRTLLDEWSARRRDLYLTTHDTHNRQISMHSVGFEPTISAGERPAAERDVFILGVHLMYTTLLLRLYGIEWLDDKWIMNWKQNGSTAICCSLGDCGIHSFSSLSYDRSKASSKASSPHSAIQSFLLQMRVSSPFLNPLNAKLNPICHLLVLLGAHPILHVSRIKVKVIQ